MSFWYAHWNKRGMTVFCFKYSTLMVWHSKRAFYARCSRKSWSISLVSVSEWVIISLFISYFWELCDLCLRSQSTCCQTPHVITESGSKTGYARNFYKAVCCLHQMKIVFFFFVFWLVKLCYHVWLSNINVRSALLLLQLLARI